MPNRSLAAKAKRANAERTEFALQRQYNIITKHARTTPSKAEMRALIVMSTEVELAKAKLAGVRIFERIAPTGAQPMKAWGKTPSGKPNLAARRIAEAYVKRTR